MSGGGSAALNSSDPTPLYHQIYLDLRHRIFSGILKNGERLKSEVALAEDLSVSRITVKRAMNELADEGLVTRTRGRGTIVAFRMPDQPQAGGFASLMENLQNIAATTTVDVMSFDYITPPAEVAAQLGLAGDALTQRVERRRNRDGEPFSYILTYVPEAIGRSWDEAKLTARPILQLIEDAGHLIASARQHVTAEPASALVAQMLKLPVGAPLLRVNRLVSDNNGLQVQYIEVVYRPDMFQMEMELHRREDDNGQLVWQATQ
jgi:GntR family transcriptional regulator